MYKTIRINCFFSAIRKRIDMLKFAKTLAHKHRGI